MITLDNQRQFVTTEGKRLGVYVTQDKSGHYKFTGQNGNVYGSGMTPAEFVKRFWFRDDYVGPETL